MQDEDLHTKRIFQQFMVESRRVQLHDGVVGSKRKSLTDDIEIFSSALWAIRDLLGPELADKLILDAQATPAMIEVNGEGLHPTVRSRAWWLERMTKKMPKARPTRTPFRRSVKTMASTVTMKGRNWA